MQKKGIGASGSPKGSSWVFFLAAFYKSLIGIIFAGAGLRADMSYSLNSLKVDIEGIIKETTIGVIKGDTRSLDNGSYVFGFWDLSKCLSFGVV